MSNVLAFPARKIEYVQPEPVKHPKVTDSETYEMAVDNLLKYQSEQNGDIRMDMVVKKVYEYSDKAGNRRFEAYLRIPSMKKTFRKVFACKGGLGKSWAFIYKILDQYSKGEPVQALAGPNLSFKNFVEKEFKTVYLSEVDQKQDNLTRYKSIFKTLINYFGNRPIRIITAQSVREYRLHRKKNDGVSNKTINNECILLRSIMRGAMEAKLIPTNPCAEVKLLEVEASDRKPIAVIPAIFTALWDNEPLRKFCLIMFYTGLRPGDIIYMKKDQIREIQGIKCLSIKEGKTGKSLTLPIHSALFENGVFNTDEKDEYLWAYKGSRSIQGSVTNNLSKWFRKSLLKSGITDNIVLYDFRHTYSYELEKLNISDRLARRLFGKLPEGSLRHYTHDNILQMKEAIERIPAISEKTLFESEK